MAHRFKNLRIEEITVKNHKQLLSVSLANQVAMFLPPEGSFDDASLRRYLENIKNYEEEDANLGMTLANRLRMAFADLDRKSTRLNSSHVSESRMPSSA